MFIASVLLLAGCSDARPVTPPERAPPSDGVREPEVVTLPKPARDTPDLVLVRVTLPTVYRPPAEIPALVALHGYRSGPRDFADDPFWQTLADTRSIAIVSVRATEALGEGRFGWTHDVDEDFAHVTAALERVRSSVAIDAAHVVLIGFSQGADVGFRMLVAHPDRFRGLVVMSAGALEEAPPLPDAPRRTWRDRSVFVTVGGGEGAYALGYAREIAARARVLGAHVEDRVVEAQPGHTFPPDLEEVLPRWLATIDPAFAPHD